MNAAQAEEEVEKIMKSVDRDNSGHIDYTGEQTFKLFTFFPAITFFFTIEFVIATINRENLLSKQRLETVFNMFDKVLN
jgi:calcium-dependent protein kinase